MEPLDLLWDLELQWESLDSYKKELEDLNNDSLGKAIEKKIIALNRRLQSSKGKQEKTKERLTELEKQLTISNFNIKELEKGLYDGHTTDIKQLEYLNREKEKVEKIINDTEVEVLELMGKLENTDEEIKTMENELESIKNQNSEIKDNYEFLAKGLNTKIEAMEKKIGSVEKKVDERLLTEYNRVRKSRGTGIVELKDSTCMGCNIMIPTFSMEKIKTTKGIFRCESCGRILYHIE